LPNKMLPCLKGHIIRIQIRGTVFASMVIQIMLVQTMQWTVTLEGLLM